ncbi:MAG: hypothetical protein Q7T48_13150 [Cellvibrio sp.]|uniref:hypothetical protein n=1 Tax=Cellvibrio sp. TaxID=1965322 RepID=UPI00272016CB|nr:hypothetical protein [Cellvibrio sp.]
MLRIILACVLSFAVAGCVTTFVFNQPAEINTVQDVSIDKAQVVFLRPSKGVMGAFAAIVFDITKSNNEIIGVAPAESKFVVNLTPGEHRLFATNGLQGHIMDMKVESGKRYYVLVRPIYGNGFQLTPLKHNAAFDLSQKSPEFPLWKSQPVMVEKAAGADEWYAKFKDNVDKVKLSAIKVWNEKSDEQRAQLTLLPDDAEKNN